VALKLKSYQILLIIALGIFAFLIYRTVRFFTAKPNIAVNYVAEMNKISKPENYDPSRNAYFDFQGASEYITEQPPDMYSREIAWPDWPGDMNEAQLKVVKDWVDENEKALDYFKAGSQKPYYWQEAPENKKTWEILLPLLSPVRVSVRALCWQAKLYAGENKIDAAFQNILTCYRAGILMTGKKRTLVEHFVGSALRSLAVYTGLSILSNTNVDSQKLADFQKQLDELISTRPAKIDFTCEKIFIYDIIQHIFTDDGKGNGRLIVSEAAKILNPMFNNTRSQPRSFFEVIEDLFSGSSRGNNESRINFLEIALNGPDRKEHTEALERVYNFYEDIQDQSLWQIHNQGISPSRKMDDMLKDYEILRAFVPALNNVIERNNRQMVTEDAFLAVIAALWFKAQKGIYPERLGELVEAGFLKELPLDPYGDGPLTYKRTEDGFLLYSFGADFDDDEGTYSQRWGVNGGDQVFWPLEQKKEQK